MMVNYRRARSPAPLAQAIKQSLCALGLEHRVHVTLHLALGDAVVANGTDLQRVPPSGGAVLGGKGISHKVPEIEVVEKWVVTNDSYLMADDG